MKLNQPAILKEIKALLQDPATRQWEQKLLQQAQTALLNGTSLKVQLDRLEASLRPLALRNSLTPAVADFYLRLTGDPAGDERFDYSLHYQPDPPYQQRAIFSGGCFWCLVEPFTSRPGIKAVISGYTGGHIAHPTYDQVSSRTTGHVEAVEIIFDSRKITYQEILAVYWNLIDPTDADGQFDDRGNNYRPLIFYLTPEQQALAEKSKNELAASKRYKKPIAVGIRPAQTFWPAENYHQDFYRKFDARYKKLKHSRQQILAFQHLHGRLRAWFKTNISQK
ncbi:peptide methionine sulfoxide reductase [Ligilactobacillus salitolerans]|uniref:Peptide methionine sulfoxide reductase MsrA n=1 Tax=Ligilactobacillus salitolerans TaxID=1808352 RepID=A0A401IQ48_9LACO|nr:peptide-methionine (S)-S-oxide reductase MsrA [Ligilactobacillus salitolerans]GBG93635.1 peptide methionine sulfoxide reductase [Ligilactobacillus salitolerans]